MTENRPRASEQRVASLTDYIGAILAITREWQKDPAAEIWFRGHAKRSHRLVPSAYRSKRDHESMFLYFMQAGGPLLSPTPVTSWQWYFAAQHYGIPTRLLDWTEDPLIALYFALADNTGDEGAPQVDESDPPCVWLLDPSKLNAATHHEKYVFVTGEGAEAVAQPWCPIVGSRQDAIPSYPIAIHPAQLTPRIIAQRGVFTVHGSDASAIDAIDIDRLEGGLLSVVVEQAVHVLEELRDLGFSRYRLFPECAALAEHIRHLYAREHVVGAGQANQSAEISNAAANSPAPGA